MGLSAANATDTDASGSWPAQHGCKQGCWLGCHTRPYLLFRPLCVLSIKQAMPWQKATCKLWLPWIVLMAGWALTLGLQHVDVLEEFVELQVGSK